MRVRTADGAAGKALILTSRLFDTEAALDRVGGAPVLALSLQNGLRKNESLVRRFGAESVAPAVSMLAAEMLTPGVVESVGLGKTLVESGHRALRSSFASSTGQAPPPSSWTTAARPSGRSLPRSRR